MKKTNRKKYINQTGTLIVLITLAMFSLPHVAATTEYWDTPEECVIDADRTDVGKTIVYTCDIIVNNSATWSCEDCILQSNQVSSWQYEIHLAGDSEIIFTDTLLGEYPGSSAYKYHNFDGYVDFNNVLFKVSERAYVKKGEMHNCDIDSAMNLDGVSGDNVVISNSDFRYLSMWYNSNTIHFEEPYSKVDWYYLRGKGATLHGYVDVTGEGYWYNHPVYVDEITRYFPVCVYSDAGITPVPAGCEIAMYYNGNLVDTQVTDGDGCVELGQAFNETNYDHSHDVRAGGVTYKSDLNFYTDAYLGGVTLENVNSCGGSTTTTTVSTTTTTPTTTTTTPTTTTTTPTTTTTTPTTTTTTPTTTTTTPTTTTTLPSCIVGADCSTCSGWVNVGPLTVRDDNNNEKYDQICCSATNTVGGIFVI